MSPDSRWKRVKAWALPSPSPAPVRFDTTAEELLTQLGSPRPEVAAALLEEAQEAYDAVVERAESAERRAATIQGSIAITASLAVAGGSLLLDASKIPSRDWRIALGVGLALTVIVLAVAAWRAFLVTWPRFMWAAPAVTEVVDHAKVLGLTALQLQRTSDLLVAYGRNDSIARSKLRLLGEAVRWLIAALVLLAILAVLLAAYAIQRPSELGSTGHKHRHHLSR